jgi:hypothetical protein
MKPERQTPQPALDHRDPTALVRVDNDSEIRRKRETVWGFFCRRRKQGFELEIAFKCQLLQPKSTSENLKLECVLIAGVGLRAFRVKFKLAMRRPAMIHDCILTFPRFGSLGGSRSAFSGWPVPD